MEVNMKKVIQRNVFKEKMKVQFIPGVANRFTMSSLLSIGLEAECKWMQLRMKDAPMEEIEETALLFKSLCINYDAVFIIDDYVELAKKIGADGVHLGKDDMPIAEARKYLGEDFIIGATANTYEDVVKHYHDGADYIGCGPFRFTETKKNLSPILGLEGYKDIINKMKANNIDIPLVAIGGITADDIPALLDCGVEGIAISGYVVNASWPMEAMLEVMYNAKLITWKYLL